MKKLDLREWNNGAVVQVFEQTIAYLKMDIAVFFSWGPNNMKAVGRILTFNVQGYLHRGLVNIRLNGSDLFDVVTTDEELNIVEEKKDLYFDQLLMAIDEMVETKSAA